MSRADKAEPVTQRQAGDALFWTCGIVQGIWVNKANALCTRCAKVQGELINVLAEKERKTKHCGPTGVRSETASREFVNRV